MLPDIDSIQLFLRAVRSGSLTKAAQQCNISLPAASRRISLLEHHFRVALVERHPTGVIPTAAGEALASHASVVLSAMESMAADLADYSAGGAGKIRLFANTSAMSQRLPDLLASWGAQNPHIRIEVHEARSRDILDHVKKGTADLGVVTSAPVPDLEFISMGRDDLCVIVPECHPLAASSVAFVELLDQDFVALDDSTASTLAMKQAAEAAGRILRLRLQVKSFDAVCKLVETGLGIAILPRGIIPAKHSLKVRCIELLDPWAAREMYVCARFELRQAAVKRFIQFLVWGEADYPNPD